MRLFPELTDAHDVSSHQAEQWNIATSNRIGILTGGPGTGKSFLMSRAAMLMDNVHFCAPTGRAAARIDECLQENGISCPTSTIHRMLGPRRNGHDGEGWGFEYHKTNKLPVDLVVCDEFSMADAYLARCLFDAIAPSAAILLVGDPDQLPPVGQGRPFLDLIKSEVVPHGHLTETHRFAGRIATWCQEVNEGKRPEWSKQIDTDAEFPENFIHIETRGGTSSVLKIKELIDRFRNRTSNVARDVQVVTAKNKGSQLSRETLNIVLQNHLNPNGMAIEKSNFRQGDKIMCLANGAYKVSDPSDPFQPLDGETQFVANGDIGFITRIAKKSMVVRIANKDVLVYRSEWVAFDLAYAITCHKSQGGQWPFVITVCDDNGGARRVCNRSWWYTAASRNKVLGVTVGAKSLILRDCKKVDVLSRRTHLTAKIRDEAKKDQAI